MTRLNRLPCASRTGYIMGNTMTIAALRIFIMNCITVWLTMAILAFRQLAVGRMTLGTGKSSMLCDANLQQLESLPMTTGTDLFRLGDWIGNSQRGVHWMAGKAIRNFKSCHGAVVLMAFSTLRDAPVLF